MIEPIDLKIGEEVVVYASGRIRAISEEKVWCTKSKAMVARLKYTVDYPDDQGFSSVTGKIIERRNVVG